MKSFSKESNVKSFKSVMFLLGLSLIFTISILSAQEGDSSIEGVWEGTIKQRKKSDFSADIGVKKMGDGFYIRGVSKDKQVMWYGNGTLSGGTLEYKYKVRYTNIEGTASLKLSSDGKELEGDFEEAIVNKDDKKKKKPEAKTEDKKEEESGEKGNEKWNKIDPSKLTGRREDKRPVRGRLVVKPTGDARDSGDEEKPISE